MNPNNVSLSLPLLNFGSLPPSNSNSSSPNTNPFTSSSNTHHSLTLSSYSSQLSQLYHAQFSPLNPTHSQLLIPSPQQQQPASSASSSTYLSTTSFNATNSLLSPSSSHIFHYNLSTLQATPSTNEATTNEATPTNQAAMSEETNNSEEEHRLQQQHKLYSNVTTTKNKPRYSRSKQFNYNKQDNASVTLQQSGEKSVEQLEYELLNAPTITSKDSSGNILYHCSICSCTFTRNSNLTRHKRIHLNMKRFQCSVCQKKFMEKHHLIAHQRVHQGNKPYQCSHCSRTFTDQSNCTRHERTHFEQDVQELEDGRSDVDEDNGQECKKKRVSGRKRKSASSSSSSNRSRSTRQLKSTRISRTASLTPSRQSQRLANKRQMAQGVSGEFSQHSDDSDSEAELVSDDSDDDNTDSSSQTPSIQQPARPESALRTLSHESLQQATHKSESEHSSANSLNVELLAVAQQELNKLQDEKIQLSRSSSHEIEQYLNETQNAALILSETQQRFEKKMTTATHYSPPSQHPHPVVDTQSLSASVSRKASFSLPTITPSNFLSLTTNTKTEGESSSILHPLTPNYTNNHNLLSMSQQFALATPVSFTSPHPHSSFVSHLTNNPLATPTTTTTSMQHINNWPAFSSSFSTHNLTNSTTAHDSGNYTTQMSPLKRPLISPLSFQAHSFTFNVEEEKDAQTKKRNNNASPTT